MCEIIVAQHCANSALVYVAYSLLVAKDVYVETRFDISMHTFGDTKLMCYLEFRTVYIRACGINAFF